MYGMITGMVGSFSRGIMRTLEAGSAILSDISREKQGIRPTTEKQRHRCPFYGFYMGPGFFMDQDGNQCALITDSYSPCQMEIEGSAPKWDECYFNNMENKGIVEKIVSSSKICPNEFRPKGETSWEGMPFKEWQRYIMNQPNQ